MDHGSIRKVADLGIVGCLGVEILSHILFSQLIEGARLEAGDALPDAVKVR